MTDSHDMVSQLSKVGTSGKFPNNAERDTHRLVHRLGSSLAAFIEMNDPATSALSSPVEARGKCVQTVFIWQFERSRG